MRLRSLLVCGGLVLTLLFAGSTSAETRGAPGAAVETVLFSFNVGAGGSYPTSLVFDSAGNMYGTTTYGGESSLCPHGCGVAFKLNPPSRSRSVWTETVLHS